VRELQYQMLHKWNRPTYHLRSRLLPVEIPKVGRACLYAQSDLLPVQLEYPLISCLEPPASDLVEHHAHAKEGPVLVEDRGCEEAGALETKIIDPDRRLGPVLFCEGVQGSGLEAHNPQKDCLAPPSPATISGF